ncbi:MAG: hypothetical protein ACI8PW_001588 [Methylophilaceae bacterium]|jgi:hypothetical protein
MLKTVPTKQVKCGLYTHELKGVWVDHPFWKRKFTLDSPKDLQSLGASVITEVVIDTSKGLDVEAQKQAQTKLADDAASLPKGVPVCTNSIKKVGAAE